MSRESEHVPGQVQRLAQLNCLIFWPITGSPVKLLQVDRYGAFERREHYSQSLILNRNLPRAHRLARYRVEEFDPPGFPWPFHCHFLI